MNKLISQRLLAALVFTLLLFACMVASPGSVLAQDAGAEAPAVEQPAASDPEAPAEEPAAEGSETPADSTEEPPEEPSSEPETPAEPAEDEPTEDEPAEDEPAEDEPAEDEPAEDEPAEDEPAEDEPAEDEPEASEDSTEETPAADGEEQTESGTGLKDETTTKSESSEGTPWAAAGWVALTILLVFILPGIVGSRLAKTFSLPDHGWKMSLALATTVAGILAIASAASREGGFKVGPDLGGGITLVYDLEDPDSVVSDDDLNGQNPEEVAEEVENQDRRAPVSMSKMLAALKQRVDPSGTKEVTIRTRGKSIEFIVPRAGQAELDDLKDRITNLGQLEFRILVDRTRNEFSDEVKAAGLLPPGQTEVRIDDSPVARWVPYDIREFGPVDEVEEGLRGQAVMKRQGANGPEILVYLDPYDVTGEYVRNASRGIGQDGVQVEFNFNSEGANRFGGLTGKYTPNPNPYFLGILLDNQLRSAPSIRSKITSSGTISGRGMDTEEVDRVVDIINAGSLPAALQKTPVSEEQTGPEIGEITLRQGTRAMIVSLSIVLVFILFYYRFAGMVACLALVVNIVLVVGAMVILNAAFTLPGIAGLVLTVGMSVDANVLIFERIREELARGSTLRMAIRNGFDRATTTIVDANVTTLITAVVLYVIGTDQIRGFAITLFLGIIMSMYTAIFCARILFDIGERNGWITKLNMMQLLSKTSFDFMSKWPVAAAGSVILIVVGMLGVSGRQTSMLNIDFTGGTSVTMVLKESMEITDVRAALEETDLKDKNLLVVERKQDSKPGTSYKIDCSLQDQLDPETGQPVTSAVKVVEDILADTFEGKLKTFIVEADPLESFTEGEGDSQFTGYQAKVRFGGAEDSSEISGVTHDSLTSNLMDVLDQLDKEGITPVVTNPEYTEGSSRRFAEWTIRLSGLDETESQAVMTGLVDNYNGEPLFPLANKIGGRVAGDLRLQAIQAIGVSLLGIVGYIWIRFQKISYGLAAVVALIHDVLVTLGLIALSAFVVSGVPALASALQIEAFQISLPIVAAFLTIIGYSLNDTIVVFDRIREVRGKSPNLSADMINSSVNQTLSRTLLTSLTTLIVVTILYFFGGDGIHGFAFSLVVGVIVGTYSSIFIASPTLLWLSKYEQKWNA